MYQHNQAPVHLFLVVLACALFAIAAFGWPAPVDPWRTRLIAAGLLFWTLSTFFG